MSAFLGEEVNAFLRGEVAQGAVAGEPGALGTTFATVVGGALWLNGALCEGAHGAGEIGHLPGFGDLPCTCGGRGHPEALASGRSLAARYGERTGRRLTVRGVAEAVGDGDPDALAVRTRRGDKGVGGCVGNYRCPGGELTTKPPPLACT